MTGRPQKGAGRWKWSGGSENILGPASRVEPKRTQWKPMSASHCLQASNLNDRVVLQSLAPSVTERNTYLAEKAEDVREAGAPVCLVVGPQTKKMSQQIRDNVGKPQQCVPCWDLSITTRISIWPLNFGLLNLASHISCDPHYPKIMQGELRGTALQLSYTGTT